MNQAVTHTSYEDLAKQMESLPALAPEAPRAATITLVNVCDTWKRVKPTVELGVKIVRMFPLKPFQTLATALDSLIGTLNMICVG